MQRLTVEKDVLRAEEQGEPGGALDELALWRHGARGHGTMSYPELGLAAITEDELRYWVARYFTRDNAVLWIAGDRIPAGLRPALPGGRREPAPALTSTLPVTPAWFAGSAPVVGWSALLSRGETAAVFAGVLERDLFRALRHEAGLSYTAQARHQTIAGDAALITAAADAVSEKQGAVLGGFVDVLARMRIGRIDPADVAAAVQQRRADQWHADQRGDRLPVEAMNLLAGRPAEPIEALLAATAAVTPGHVAAAAANAYATGLLMTPGGTTGDWAGFSTAPDRSTAVVEGTTWGFLGEPDCRLILSPEGVSLAAPTRAVTVRFDACAIVRAWPDGARHLIGHDGISVRIEPTLLQDGHQAVSALDSHVPPVLRVDQPPRDPDRVPSPRKATRRLRFPVPRFTKARLTKLPLLAVVVVIASLVRGVLEAADAPNASMITLLFGVTLVVAIAVWRRLSRADVQFW